MHHLEEVPDPHLANVVYIYRPTTESLLVDASHGGHKDRELYSSRGLVYKEKYEKVVNFQDGSMNTGGTLLEPQLNMLNNMINTYGGTREPFITDITLTRLRDPSGDL